MDERVKLLIDSDDLDKFRNSNILLVGLGGVGGACFEALVRLGIKKITIVDGDSFDESNLNRQILATRLNIGHLKVSEAVLRAESINPDFSVDSKDLFLNESNIDLFNYLEYDYIIDCCDTMTTKLLLIKKALEHNIKIISCMGTGNRLDPTKLVVTDIWKTNYDPVAKAMRKMLRDNNINDKVKVLCSLEQPKKIASRTPGSTVFVPNTAGFIIASYVFNDIISSRK